MDTAATMDIIYHNNNTTRGLSTHRHGRLVLLRAQSMLDHVLWAVFWTDAWVRTRLVCPFNWRPCDEELPPHSIIYTDGSSSRSLILRLARQAHGTRQDTIACDHGVRHGQDAGVRPSGAHAR